MSYADYFQKLEGAQRRQEELYPPPPAEPCLDADDTEPPSSMNQEQMMHIVRERFGKRVQPLPQVQLVMSFGQKKGIYRRAIADMCCLLFLIFRFAGSQASNRP
jgi:hypothetical protein